MSEVKRYAICGAGKWQALEVKAGAWVRWYDFAKLEAERDAQRLRADTAEARVKTAEHDLEFFKAGKNEQFDRAEAAEQRIAELLDLLRDINDAPGGSQFRKSIEAALNPNPEAESHE